MARLREGTGPNANNALAAGVLATVGELAKVVRSVLERAIFYILFSYLA